MWLKVLIVILFFTLLLSLGRGLAYLLKDQGTTKRTFHSLGVRLVLAVALMGLVTYGMMTGKLKSQAPWDAKLQQSQSQSLQP
jgi:p-aminobenzoyl-glutamate transporter AbgT